MKVCLHSVSLSRYLLKVKLPPYYIFTVFFNAPYGYRLIIMFELGASKGGRICSPHFTFQMATLTPLCFLLRFMILFWCAFELRALGDISATEDFTILIILSFSVQTGYFYGGSRHDVFVQYSASH